MKEELVAETIKLRERISHLEQSLALVRQREEAGEEAEATTKAMIEAFDGFIYVCSPNYEVEFMNERFIQRTGHNPTGEKCYQALHDLKEVCPWCVNEKVQNGETVRWEVQSPKDNRWYYVVNTPVRHRDGTISKMAVIQDITQRKQAEELLRKAKDELEVRVQERTSELEFSVQRLEKEISVRKETEAALCDSQERLALALEAAELNVWDWDLINGKTIRRYPGFDMLGYSPDDFEAEVGAWKRLIHAEDWPSVSKSLNEHLEGKLPIYEAEYRTRTKSGDWRWILTRGKVLERDPNGRAIRMLGTSQDITDRKRAEEEIREQREFLHTVVESLSHPFYVINADDYTIALANRATMLCSTEEKQACYSVLHHRECPCDGAEHPCPIEQVKKRGQPAGT